MNARFAGTSTRELQSEFRDIILSWRQAKTLQKADRKQLNLLWAELARRGMVSGSFSTSREAAAD